MVENRSARTANKSASTTRSSRSYRKASQAKIGVSALGTVAAVGAIAYATRGKWLPLLRRLGEKLDRHVSLDLTDIWPATRSTARKNADRPITHPNQSAMQDVDINRRLEQDPADADAKLDAGLDQSMDASDPPAIVQPGDDGEPVPSSGFDEDHEADLIRATRGARSTRQRVTK